MSGPARAPRPGRIQRWLAGRTLRGRLIAGVLVLLALACAAVGVATYASLHRSLISQIDLQLTDASHRYYNCEDASHGDHDSDGGDQGHGRPPPQCVPGEILGLQPGTFTAMVSHGQVKHPSVTLGHCHLSAADTAVLTALPANRQPATHELSSLGDYRLTAVPASDGSVLVTGLPLASVESTLRSLAVVELIVFSAALLCTGVLGTAFVRLSLRPLRRVAATATRVTQLPLASGEVSLPERVPYDNSRTEVGQVGSAFNRMLGHVESALARRAASENRLRRFAADASHELRTPLAAIRGYAELARHHPGPIPDDMAHALGRVESESARMSVLVDELLLLAQLDAGRPLARQEVDLTRLALDATSDARAAGPRHRWRLELPDEPVVVRGDEHRLRQVLANLLSNAAKHTPAGTTVTTALATDPAARTAALSVTDDGPGIPPDLLPTLFERFVRGDTARSHGVGSTSTGLGLAIVDAVTAAHGGTVEVTSEPGRTRFLITLPTSDPTAADTAAGAGHDSIGHGGAGHDGAGHDGAGHESAGHDGAGHDGAGDTAGDTAGQTAG